VAPEQLDRLRWWVCGRKKRRTRAGAMRLAVYQRERGEQIAAYRCPFNPTHWHVGGPPSMRTLRKLAEYLRDRHAAVQPPEALTG